jgi:SRSO17 transposase
MILDDTGDRKKGKTTDYVDRQYIANMGKVDNGRVSVNAYGVLDNLTFPLLFKVFKPRYRLKAEDVYQTKLQLAQQIIQELLDFGFRFSFVLADSFYLVRASSKWANRMVHLAPWECGLVPCRTGCLCSSGRRRTVSPPSYSLRSADGS